MKSYIVILCIVCTMLFPSLGHASQPGDMYLRFLEGDVQVKTEDTTEWLPASINMPLIDGDQIWVPDNARAELMLRDGTIVRLDRNSYLEILTSEERRPQFYLAMGRAYTNTRLRTGDAVLFETPIVSFRAYGRSLFGIDVTENEDSILSVFQGEVYADHGTGQTKINTGDKMVFYKNAEYPRLARIDPLDQWEQWNRRKDQEFSMASSTTYLPDELSVYYNDFERNGRWAYEQEYGYVWTPTVITVKDWSPYRVGRWVWMRGDYVWISYEPWGWAPYHYGRWAFTNNRGWCWVPPARDDVYWGPGFVGWVHTPTYISWVPLAPRETYYGHGDYGPNSVNIRNANINTSAINNAVYRNIHVSNAVTTLHRDAFMTGRSTNRPTKENFFLKERRAMGAPDIRPERPAFMPVIKDIPQEKRPPQKIVNRVLDERKRNNSVHQIRTRGNIPAGPIGIMTPRTGQTNDRKIEPPQSPNNTSLRTKQMPPVKNPNVITGPQESREEKATRRLGELRRNGFPQNNIKEIGPQQAAPVRPSIIQERKVEVQGRAPKISVNEQPPKANIIEPQTPKLPENVRPLPSARSNSPAVTTQPQPQKSVTVQPQQAAPVRPSIIQERGVEVPIKNADIPINRPQVKVETRQPRASQVVENRKLPPPSIPNSQPAITQPPAPPPPQNTKDVPVAQKTQPVARVNPVENIPPQPNKRNFNREAGTEMQQKRR